jgi:hypothetical protein
MTNIVVLVSAYICNICIYRYYMYRVNQVGVWSSGTILARGHEFDCCFGRGGHGGWWLWQGGSDHGTRSGPGCDMVVVAYHGSLATTMPRCTCCLCLCYGGR